MRENINTVFFKVSVCPFVRFGCKSGSFHNEPLATFLLFKSEFMEI